MRRDLERDRLTPNTHGSTGKISDRRCVFHVGTRCGTGRGLALAILSTFNRESYLWHMSSR